MTMSSTLTTIARTISEELERAVAAAEEAQNAGLDLISQETTIAITKQRETLHSAAELEREAAELIAKAIKLRESAQMNFESEMKRIVEKVHALKAEGPRRVSSKKSKALPPSDDGEAPTLNS
jgi:hypothetical protein